MYSSGLSHLQQHLPGSSNNPPGHHFLPDGQCTYHPIHNHDVRTREESIELPIHLVVDVCSRKHTLFYVTIQSYPVTFHTQFHRSLLRVCPCGNPLPNLATLNQILLPAFPPPPQSALPDKEQLLHLLLLREEKKVESVQERDSHRERTTFAVNLSLRQ